MIRTVPAIGVVAVLLIAPIAAIAQQPAPGDGVETYSDTLPKHGTSAKKLVALKTSSRKGHKPQPSGKSHHSGKKKGKATD